MGISFNPSKKVVIKPKDNELKPKNNEPKTEQTSSDTSNEEVQQLLNEHSKYIGISVDNLSALSSKGFNTSIFAEEHHSYAAKSINLSEFTSARTEADQRRAVDNIKSRVQNAVQGFKNLISKEEQALNSNLSRSTLMGNQKSNNPMSMNGTIFQNRRPMG